MDALKRLQELGDEWYVVLLRDAGSADWSLTIRSRRDPSTEHTYLSQNLERLINHAWAGAPGGRC